MYTVDSLDEVLNFEGVPGHSPGAPMPKSWQTTLASCLLMRRRRAARNASRFRALRHFVFTFHDNTFECVANDAALAAKFPNDETAKKLLGLMASHLS